MLSCNPFKGLLLLAVGRDPKGLTSYLPFFLGNFYSIKGGIWKCSVYTAIISGLIQ